MKQNNNSYLSSNKTFEDLPLKKNIKLTLNSLGFKIPTRVQEETIPLILDGKNVVITSSTGSGETIAYTIPILGRIDPKKGVQALILTPTRELTEQVGSEVKKFCDLLGLKVGVFFGGRDIKGDYKVLQRKNQIIIGSPGRIIQLINNKTLRVGEVSYIVFDESDQMFENGFFGDCIYVKKRISSEAQIVLSSATMTSDVVDFVEKHIVYFEFVEPDSRIPEGILQKKAFVKIPDKNEFIKQFLDNNSFKRALIFCNTKTRVEEVNSFLLKNGFRSRAIHSDLEQKERKRNLQFLKEGRKSILVATDVAGRGLHIDNVELIINYDIPTRKEAYIHRIGRTGRNGLKGYALNLICPEDEERFKNIEDEFELNVETYEDESFSEWTSRN